MSMRFSETENKSSESVRLSLDYKQSLLLPETLTLIGNDLFLEVNLVKIAFVLIFIIRM